MQTKIIQFIPAALSIVFIAFSYLGFACAESKQCFASSFFWDNTFSFLEPMQIYLWAVLAPFIIAIFVKETVFKSWLRLATWFVPLALIIIFITPVTSNSWMPIFFISREEIAWYLGILFSIISLVLIIWKWFFAHRHNAIQV